MKINNQKGITLIALVITIIVIVILTAITINAVVGDHGIISETKQAKDDYYSAENAEQETLDSAVSAIRRAKIEAGMISGGSGSSSNNNNSNNNNNENNNENNNNNNNNNVNEVNGGLGQQDDPVETITQNTGVIGTATNSNKYGWKVQGYTGGDLVWRLFYEDENNVYLISEAQDGTIPVKNVNIVEGHYLRENETPTGVWNNDYNDYSPIHSKYVSGESVSQQGRNIMPLAAGAASTSYGTNSNRYNIFTSSNIYPSIWAVAYLCDTTEWTQYKQGNASWTMGAPSFELYVASYNATHNTKQVLTMDVSDNEYFYNTNNRTGGSGENHGIYGGAASNDESDWWLASVYYATESLYVSEYQGDANVYSLRKLV